MFRDLYGSLWDRTIDRDIGTLSDAALKEPSLKGFRWPKCAGGEAELRKQIAAHGDVAIHCSFGFTLFERSWGLRGSLPANWASTIRSWSIWTLNRPLGNFSTTVPVISIQSSLLIFLPWQ